MQTTNKSPRCCCSCRRQRLLLACVVVRCSPWECSCVVGRGASLVVVVCALLLVRCVCLQQRANDGYFHHCVVSHLGRLNHVWNVIIDVDSRMSRQKRSAPCAKIGNSKNQRRDDGANLIMSHRKSSERVEGSPWRCLSFVLYHSHPSTLSLDS